MVSSIGTSIGDGGWGIGSQVGSVQELTLHLVSGVESGGIRWPWRVCGEHPGQRFVAQAGRTSKSTRDMKRRVTWRCPMVAACMWRAPGSEVHGVNVASITVDERHGVNVRATKPSNKSPDVCCT